MNKKILIFAMITFIIIVSVAWYLASPLFINKEVNEDLPHTNQQIDESSIVYIGDFVDADSFHQTSGKAKIIIEGDNKYLRLEDFETTNGPGLKVYLSEDLEANSYISLGDLKGNIGNQNYIIDEEIDFEKYKYVLIWCEPFEVLFGHAELTS